ncbi:hypothetical protein [Qipengyuania sp. DGS5-3]|uniref:hypothetical protein n=1 Tax=Qipengyuania sp. DGS5-3 TaxID=3349632 RepID=UPI0036D2652B
MMVDAVKAPQLAIFFTLQLMACSPVQKDTSEADDVLPDMYSSTGEIYYLEPSEREAVEAKASEGDKEALDAIINHYELGGVEDNIGPLMHWLRLAHQRGDQKRLRDLVFFSRDSDLDCTEIVSYFDALQELDPNGASELKAGRVAECLANRQ